MRSLFVLHASRAERRETVEKEETGTGRIANDVALAMQSETVSEDATDVWRRGEANGGARGANAERLGAQIGWILGKVSKYLGKVSK